MTATVPDAAAAEPEAEDSIYAQWPGAAPGCPSWATSTHYDYGSDEWDVIAHRFETHIHGSEGWVAYFDAIVTSNPHTGEMDIDGVNISVRPPGGSVHDGVELDRLGALNLMRELAFVLGVKDLRPLLAPVLLTSDPYRPGSGAQQ